MEWEPKLRTRYVGLLMNVLEYRFRDDIPTKLAAFERTVHDYENQSTKTVDDDIKMGVTMLGMEDMRVKEHLIRNSVRITSWNQMREEILEITRTQEYIDSQPMPMQLGESEEQRQGQREQRQWQRQGHQGQRQGQGCEKRIVQESEKRRSEKVLLLQQNRSREGRVQTETEGPCRGRRETGGSVATSTRRNSDRAVIVLTFRRETLVNVCQSHALCTDQTVRSLGAGSFAPAATERTRPIVAIPSNETYMMMETCAGPNIFPRGFEQNATDDDGGTSETLDSDR